MPEKEKKKYYDPTDTAQHERIAKYNKEKYDEFKVRLPKGYKDDIRAAAAALNLSVNAYIKGAVDRRMHPGD